MLPVGNQLYTLVLSGEKPKLVNYKQVLPINKPGDKVAFSSPIMNFYYRKMLYFISNKANKQEKRGIVLPYLNDNYSVFSKKEGASQFCQFFEYKDTTGKDHFDILNFLPETAQTYHYTLQGQIKEITKLKNVYKNYGESVVALSPDGTKYLHCFEEDFDFKEMRIVEMKIKAPTRMKKAIKEDSANETINFSKQSKAVYEEFMSKSLRIRLIESLKTDQMAVDCPLYGALKKQYLNEIISHHRQLDCDIRIEINNKGDIVIGFLYKNKYGKNSKSYLKDLFLLRKDAN
jgi:hypothetical protein